MEQKHTSTIQTIYQLFMLSVITFAYRDKKGQTNIYCMSERAFHIFVDSVSLTLHLQLEKQRHCSLLILIDGWKTGSNRECSDRQRAETSQWLVDRRKSRSALCKWAVMQSNNGQLKGRHAHRLLFRCKTSFGFSSYPVFPKYKKKDQCSHSSFPWRIQCVSLQK